MTRYAPSAFGLLRAAVPTAETYAQLGGAPVTISPTCSGTASVEAMVAPLQEADRVENGVRVAVHFASNNHDSSCALIATATWRNLNTGESGSETITVASTADPASGGHYGNKGYNRAHFWTGPGTVLIAASTHPTDELEVTV